MKKFIASIAIIFTAAFFVKPIEARQDNKKIARYAINLHWCGKVKTRCKAGDEAYRIAGCETGDTYDVYASNGQYLGIFQMGSYERKRFGHGWNAWEQAKAAHKYYKLSGWNPWSCRWAA